MTKMVFQAPDGRAFDADFEIGQNVMKVAVDNDVPGIEGECGGELNCGTCHVYVDEAWVGRVPARDEEEEDMLEVVDCLRDSSRLSCQIRLTADLDGLTVRVADTL